MRHCRALSFALSASFASSARTAPLSAASKMEKRGLSCRAFASCRRMRAPSAWKVDTLSDSSGWPGSSCFARSRISFAALLVKVMAAICSGLKPRCRTRWAIFCVMTRVLPEPAPASTSSGPSR